MVQGCWYIDTPVREFHIKHEIPAKHWSEIKHNHRVESAGMSLQTWARCLKNHDDVLELRAHLLCEELGEFLLACHRGDPVEMLDGLADLLYVVFGTAIQLELPLSDAYEEVCRSNMTKEKSDGNRVRGKGDSFEPPRLAPLLGLSSKD